MTHNLTSLKKRRQFLALAKTGRKIYLPAVIVQAAPAAGSDGIRFGLTVTKKIGRAVCRNRARRRLRALARELLPSQGQVGYDYVLVARHESISRPYHLLHRDLLGGLGALHRKARNQASRDAT